MTAGNHLRAIGTEYDRFVVVKHELIVAAQRIYGVNFDLVPQTPSVTVGDARELVGSVGLEVTEVAEGLSAICDSIYTNRKGRMAKSYHLLIDLAVGTVIEYGEDWPDDLVPMLAIAQGDDSLVLPSHDVVQFVGAMAQTERYLRNGI
jgi:hypothetical protein